LHLFFLTNYILGYEYVAYLVSHMRPTAKENKQDPKRKEKKSGCHLLSKVGRCVLDLQSKSMVKSWKHKRQVGV
jgi:hypothetical protein